MSFRKSEPLIIRGAVVAAVTALLHTLVVVGALPLDPDQETAIAGFVDLLGTAVLVVWSRGAVTPTAKRSSEGVIQVKAPEEFQFKSVEGRPV